MICRRRWFIVGSYITKSINLANASQALDIRVATSVRSGLHLLNVSLDYLVVKKQEELKI